MDDHMHEAVRARAIRILRAKAAELEAEVEREQEATEGVGDTGALRADVALVAGIVADLAQLASNQADGEPF